MRLQRQSNNYSGSFCWDLFSERSNFLTYDSLFNFPYNNIFGHFLLVLKHVPGDHLCLGNEVALPLLYHFFQLFAHLVVAVARLRDDEVQEDHVREERHEQEAEPE